ncbi:MAG TPA: hypothetical protein RMH85_10135 [Polyangiaceae bacterium LLY-WYZ-15_(1-7)]|nr:hypothetical protein [Myxococcales bacterium]MAT23974.1 hypothetical protein [Sandaracinus sp.]HJL05593.1 hypothetical protein [Polyangiaceae bacterium LLY-WYZ-15_(1-7)]MBJ71631.1 hypothetical protein [Sandaracinus sp.]HJL08849.1 hypothetical protein [Polyangiaceae bacterium LLY-WYZ-15_(1-7)]
MNDLSFFFRFAETLGVLELALLAGLHLAALFAGAKLRGAPGGRPLFAAAVLLLLSDALAALLIVAAPSHWSFYSPDDPWATAMTLGFALNALATVLQVAGWILLVAALVRFGRTWLGERDDAPPEDELR